MGLPCINIFGWNILSFSPHFYISHSWVKREKRKGRFTLSTQERVRLMGTWSPCVWWWLITPSTLHSFCFDFSPWIEGYSRMLRPASIFVMSHFQESVPVLYKMGGKILLHVKKQVQRRARQGFTHPPQHGAALVSSERALWWCRRSTMGHTATAGAGAKSSGRASFGSNTLNAPTQSFHQLSQRAETYHIWWSLDADMHNGSSCRSVINPGLVVIVIKLLAPFYLQFSKRKNPFMR